ncbi:unnamed protein product [Effrenium voratum]|nr:unnamed protein product [Effrenium voratum]
MRRILGLLPLAAADWGASTKGTKVLLTEAAADGAVCLDGSAPAYYIAPGSGDGANKWYIHHQGGGWCESLDDCLGRSKTALGSSSGYPETMELSSGYFSNSSSVNPLMYNWNKVHMSYCDGGSFSGDNDTVTVYKGAKLHFRGRRIREAIAKDLMAKGLGRASDLVVSGCSAGGLATYLHTDQWCHTLKSAQPSAKCVGLPDSGFFLDYQDPDVKCVPEEHMLTETINGDYHCGLRWTFGIQNATRGVDAKCLAVHSGEEWKCMFAEHAAEHVVSPMFALQSIYDTWQEGHVQGTGGAAKTRELGRNITARLEANLLGKNPKSGAFLDSCSHHCGLWNSIRIDGDLVSVAVKKWYEGLDEKDNKRLWNQHKPFPCKDCCHPDEESSTVVI